MILVGWDKETMKSRTDFIRADSHARFRDRGITEFKDDQFNSQSGRCVVCLYSHQYTHQVLIIERGTSRVINSIQNVLCAG